MTACADSLGEARRFASKGQWFTAYLYLFVAFNNLYSWLAPDERRQGTRIRKAIGVLETTTIDDLYTHEYVSLIQELNGRTPIQFTKGPDRGARKRGILNMQKYFSGDHARDCVAHVRTVVLVEATAEDKRKTLQDVAACLLYTVRNNQFHAVKGHQDEYDRDTLRRAYEVLLPLTTSLFDVAASQLSHEG